MQKYILLGKLLRNDHPYYSPKTDCVVVALEDPPL